MAVSPQSKINFVNFFGALGYIFCALLWLLAVVAYSQVLMSALRSVTPQSQPLPLPPVQPDDPTINPFAFIIMSAVTVAVIALSIYILIRTPIVIARGGKKVVASTAQASAPIAMKVAHVKDTPPARQKFVFRISAVIKIVLVIMPLLGVFGSWFLLEHVIEYSVAIYAGVALAVVSIVWFTIQYALARAFGLTNKQLW